MLNLENCFLSMAITSLTSSITARLRLFQRLPHLIQTLREQRAGCAEVDADMSFAFLPKYLSGAKRHFCIFQEEIIGVVFDGGLGEIQPAEIGGVWNSGSYFGHIFRDVLDEKIAVAGEIAVRFFQPAVAFARERGLRGDQSQAVDVQR